MSFIVCLQKKITPDPVTSLGRTVRWAFALGTISGLNREMTDFGCSDSYGCQALVRRVSAGVTIVDGCRGQMGCGVSRGNGVSRARSAYLYINSTTSRGESQAKISAASGLASGLTAYPRRDRFSLSSRYHDRGGLSSTKIESLPNNGLINGDGCQALFRSLCRSVALSPTAVSTGVSPSGVPRVRRGCAGGVISDILGQSGHRRILSQK